MKSKFQVFFMVLKELMKQDVTAIGAQGISSDRLNPVGFSHYFHIKCCEKS